MLRTHRDITIGLLTGLHAKLFVCEAIPAGFGVIGSANLTARSLTNYEIGVLFEGRGELSPLIAELRLVVQDLRRRATLYGG